MDRKRSFSEYSGDVEPAKTSDGQEEKTKIQKSAQSPVTDSLNYDEEVRPEAEESPETEHGWHRAYGNHRRTKKKSGNQELDVHPAITHSSQARLYKHISITDFRDLIMYLLLESKAPSWVAVRRRGAVGKVVTLMIPGLEMGMFNGRFHLHELHDQEESFSTDTDLSQNQQRNGIEQSFAKDGTDPAKSSDDPRVEKEHDGPDDYYPTKIDPEDLPTPVKTFGEVFTHAWPVRANTDDRMKKVFSPVFGILTVPHEKIKEDRHMKGPKPIKADRYDDKATLITEFVAAIEDLEENGYPLHLAFGDTDSAKEVVLATRRKYQQTTDYGWVDSHVNRLEDGDVPEQETKPGDITAGRKVLAIDCEMVKTASNPLTLARVSVVDWNGTVVMDELVKPEEPIIDYVTFYSGITAEMMEPVTTTIRDIQKRLLDIVTPQTILIGHSLESDLKALKFVHPFIIDTVLQYPHPRGPPLKSSLSFLAQRYLEKQMKRDKVKGGHDSTEDARVALDLIKLKCRKGQSFGTGEGNGESIFKRLRRTVRSKTARESTDAEDFKAGAVVDWGDPSRGHGAAANLIIACESDAEVVDGVKRAVKGGGKPDHDDPEGGSVAEPVDFIWARLRELEAIRGWWSSSRPGDVEEQRQKVFARYAAADPLTDPTAPAPDVLARAIGQVAARVADVYAALPPCTAFIVYSGSGDVREVFKLGELERQFRSEYATKKWEDLSVRWTDDESQALLRAVKKARQGVGFVVVK